MKQEKSTKNNSVSTQKRYEQKQLRRKKSHPESGATFMEVLVTIAIIAILMTTIGLAVAPFIGDAQKSAAKQDINAMKVALTTYFTQNYDYPDESEWKQDRNHLRINCNNLRAAPLKTECPFQPYRCRYDRLRFFARFHAAG